MIANKKNSKDRYVPWITFKAKEWLDLYLKVNMTVFEWGSGNFTMYFSEKVKKLISVEHDENWHKKISGIISCEKISNCDYLLIKPEGKISEVNTPYSSKSYTSSTFKHHWGLCFKNYVRAIDKYPNEHFDLVFVDGRARASCIIHAIKKIKPGGYLMLDNSERAHYNKTVSLLKDYSKIDFFGKGPQAEISWQTSIWQKTVDKDRSDYDFSNLVKTINDDFEMYTTARLENVYLNFEKFTTDMFANSLKKGQTIIDVGAHYGYYSLLASKKIGDNGKIYSFEPVRENYDLLCKNVKFNDYANIKTYNLAVSDEATEKEFCVAEASDSSSFHGHPLTRTIEKRKVKSTSLDDFFATKKIDVVKIDTKGHELYVLDGMKKIAKNNDNIKLFIEFNPKCLKNAGFQPEDLLQKIDQLDFEIYLIHDQRNEISKLRKIDFKNWSRYIKKEDCANLLCFKKGKSLSVCFISHSSQMGGSERSLLQLIDGLQKKDVICQAILPASGPLETEMKKRSVACRVISYGWWTEMERKSETEVVNKNAFSLEGSFSISKKLNKWNPDIVYTNTSVTPYGAIASALLDKPHIWHVRELGEEGLGLIFDLGFENAANFINKFSNCVIANSKAISKQYSKFIPKDKMIVSYNSFPIEDIEKLKTRKVKDIYKNKGSIKLAIVGTIAETKGQKEAILAIKELIKQNKKVELTVIGKTSSPSYLEELKKFVEVNNLEGHVHFLGYVDDAIPYMNQADVFINCSRYEAFGRITLEAMLLKKPVIGARSGGTPELIQNNYNGLLYTLGDYEELTDKIKFFMENREEIEKYGNNGYSFATRTFTDQGYSGKIYEIIQNLKNTKNPLGKFSIFSKSLLKVFSNKGDSIVSLQSRLCEVEAQLQQKNTQSQQKSAQITNSNNQLSQIYNSLWWKLGWVIKNPIKFIIKYAKKIFWALVNPKKFTKKYFRKINWALHNPWKCTKKYII